jgi:hypothetical protein
MKSFQINLEDKEHAYLLEKKELMGAESWKKFLMALAEDYPGELNVLPVEKVVETVEPVIEEEVKPEPAKIKEGSIWDD